MDKKIGKNRIISGVILSTMMVLTSGCIMRQNSETAKPTVIKTSNVPKNNSTATTEVECTNEIRPEKNNCDRGTISVDELQNRPKDGEKHLLRSIRGKKIQINERSNGFIFPQYQGKVIILEMFGKNCPHCIKEIPTIESIRNKYRGQLEVIAIQSQQRMTKNEAHNYINRYNIRYPIIEGSTATNLQFFIQNTYSWRGVLPFTLVIKDGVTEFAYKGEVSYADLEKDIDSLF